jgi:endonuclease/exonuclease/phosphatase family metal-dependent hydrolase
MKLTVGTFNLNNLFSRYNFQAEIDAVRDGDAVVAGETVYSFGSNDTFKIRSYKGRLVKPKDAAGTTQVADRIRRIDVDVLAVQEAEDIDTLRQFNRQHLGGMYRHVVLIEGNDPRLIDVGVLSKYPIGAVTSWQRAVHPEAPQELVFGRDLLEIEVLNERGSGRLFTLFNTHLKSNFFDFREDAVVARQAADRRRTLQAQTMARIIKMKTRPDSRFVIVGDMNDTPTSAPLAGFVQDPELDLVNALENPSETRAAKPDNPMPASAAWTHRYKSGDAPAHYALYDQVWLSRTLMARQTGAWIDRRTRHGGDGSDHDPAWVELEL